MDDMFVAVLVILVFGSISSVLMLTGLKRLRLLEKAEIDTTGHLQSAVATFQIVIGGFGLLFTLCQSIILIRQIFTMI